MAGGRYDGLMREMGGPDVPGVGWAAGIERLAMLLAETPAGTAARGDRADRRRGRGAGLGRWRTSCAAPASPSISPSRASPGSA